MLYFEKRQHTKMRWNRYLNGMATAEIFLLSFEKFTLYILQFYASRSGMSTI